MTYPTVEQIRGTIYSSRDLKFRYFFGEGFVPDYYMKDEDFKKVRVLKIESKRTKYGSEIHVYVSNQDMDAIEEKDIIKE